MSKKANEKKAINKVKYNRLIDQKKNKKKNKEAERKARLKEILELSKSKKEN